MGSVFSAGWGAGDEVAERWWEIEIWNVQICNIYFSRGYIIIIEYIFRNNLCFDNRDSLPGDDDDGDDDDDDDTSAISTCAVEAIHDAVAEICRK